MSATRIKVRITRVLAPVRFTPRSVPWMLLGMCLLAYAPQITKMGFYWDDWPWAWLYHVFGPSGMLKIDVAHRPLSSVILWLSAQVMHTSPLGWQILNLGYRWLSVVAFWWAFKALWPHDTDRVFRMALLFLVYPGFTQQFVAINSSRHILPLAFYFSSIGFMIKGVHQSKRNKQFTFIALILALCHLLATEYYYGIELLRPFLLWFAWQNGENTQKNRLRLTLRSWLPFLILLTAVWLWRYQVSMDVNYPVTILRYLAEDPLTTSMQSLGTISRYIYLVLVEAWAQTFAFPTRAVYGLRFLALYVSIVLVTMVIVCMYLFCYEDGESDIAQRKAALVLGGFSCAIAALPFIAAGLEVDLNFPNDRALLPFLPGASILIVALMDVVLSSKSAQIALLCLGMGLAVGFHARNANSYARDWEMQRSFFQQLTLRAPGIQQDTALYYLYNVSLRKFRSTDNSLSGALNWVYRPDLSSTQIHYMIYDLRLHIARDFPPLKSGVEFTDVYGFFTFDGSSDRVIVLHYAPPSCLRILHPIYDRENPLIPQELLQVLPLSNLSIIERYPTAPATLPILVFASDDEETWCAYFQKADLARQFNDWEEVVRVGEAALRLPDAPRNETELVPFIQGYAHLGLWERAYQLTLQAVQRHTRSLPMLCTLWIELEKSTPHSAQKTKVLSMLHKQLSCAEVLTSPKR